MFLSAVWTLILTAPIHCRASIAETLMQCYISQTVDKETLQEINKGMRMLILKHNNIKMYNTINHVDASDNCNVCTCKHMHRLWVAVCLFGAGV